MKPVQFLDRKKVRTRPEVLAAPSSSARLEMASVRAVCASQIEDFRQSSACGVTLKFA
jgi:hypothetical protein